MNIEYVAPAEIEKRSMAIISDELERRGILLPDETADIVKRCIHTTADFDYAETLCFSPGALAECRRLIRGGALLVTDTNMALAGINKRELERYGARAICFMSEADVAEEAAARGITRASVSMERAMRREEPVIFVIGNAPTALIALQEQMDLGHYRPAFVIGVPVGFVNVEAAKELILADDIPHIVNRGRKGGSTVAAAICNAILYGMRGQQG